MKIFCIGMHKTATVSLATALEQLNIRTRHGYKKHSDLIKDAIYDEVDPLKYLENRHGIHDAYADLYAVRDHFVHLDQYYGDDCKFILTTREEDEWVGSVKRQIEKRPNSPFFHHWYYQNEMQWRLYKRMHEQAVHQYFFDTAQEGDPSDILIMDITKGDGWKELCTFLGCDMPDPSKPFPHENKSPQTA